MSRAEQSKSRATLYLAFSAVFIVMFGACAGGEESLPELGEASEALVTGVIPTSRLCSPFVTPEGCVAVPASDLVLGRPGPPTTIDGARGKNEYANAAELPYGDTLHKATGTLYVRAHQERAPNSALTTVSLSVFLENIPFRVGGREGKFLVILDEDRFTGSTEAYAAGDHYVELDFTLGTATETRVTSNGVVVRPYTNFQMGACSIDPSTSELARCNAELRLALRPSAVRPFTGIDKDLIPGVGFGFFPVRPGNVRGGIPELENVPNSNLKTNRKLLLTLLLGRPPGFRLQYMTWNVRRSVSEALAGPYVDVTDDAIGTYLASLGADVIALQEAWNPAKVKLIRLAANTARAAKSLPPLEAYGPVNHENTAIREILEDIGSAVIGDDGSDGGLYTLTSLPVAKSDFHAFSLDHCKGEDCLKAKGVQWTRILLNPPNPANSTCVTTSASRTCPAPPSGGEYVDVFNLHLQASEPSLCSDETMMDLLLAELAAFTIPDPINMPWLVAALNTVMVLSETEFNCSESDRDIRAAQLAEASAFIDLVTQDRRDRPVVIMGDFNIDGRTLGPEYASMLKTLRINLTGGDGINPWPYDYTWDFDHGDVARERELDDPYPTDGACMGTFLWDTPMPIVDCPHGGNVEGLPSLAGQRYDYILLRPPYSSADPNFVAAKWVAARIDDQPWTSPYPGPGQAYNPGVHLDPGPPHRLSDHKPVLVGIEHAKLQQPPKFHKTWKHDVTFRVTSADASNQGDCPGCGPVDPMTANYGYVTDTSQSHTFLKHNVPGSECEDRSSVSWPAQSCMSNWSFSAKHDPAYVNAHGYFAVLFDYDATSGNDAMIVDEYNSWPLVAMEWTVPQVTRTTMGEAFSDVPWPVTDTEPIPWCLGHHPTKMCLEVRTTELPPGQQ